MKTFLFTVLFVSVNAIPGEGPGRGPWAIEAPELHGLNSELLEQASKQVEIENEERYCMVVAKDGVIVSEHYYQGDETSQYLPYSATKTVASALMGMAITEGIVDLDDYLTDYITPECEDGCPDTLTQIKHTLSQASRPTRGTTFRYESGTQALLNNLSKVLGNATGMPTFEYMRQKFEPLGFENFDWIPEDSDGNLRFGACGELCFGSCRDYLRIGQLFLNEGEWDGEQLINPEYVRKARYPQFPEANAQYGFLTWTNANIPEKIWYSASKIRKGTGSPNPTAPEDMYTAVGAFGQIIYIIPSLNVVMSTMGRTVNPSGEDGETVTRIWEAMKPALGESPCSDCVFSHKSPGCANSAIEECVCNQHGAEFCCTAEWHPICAQISASSCGCVAGKGEKKQTL